MKVSVFKVRWNREKVNVTPKSRGKESVTTVEKSWPEETVLIAVERQELVRDALAEKCVEGQTPHLRQVDAVVRDVDLYLHVGEEAAEEAPKEGDKK